MPRNLRRHLKKENLRHEKIFASDLGPLLPQLISGYSFCFVQHIKKKVYKPEKGKGTHKASYQHFAFEQRETHGLISLKDVLLKKLRLSTLLILLKSQVEQAREG